MMLDRLIRWMLIFNVFRFESLLVNGSAYAGVILIFWPEYVYLCTQEHIHLSALAQTRGIGTFLLGGTGATAIGVALRLANRRVRWSTRFRMSGLVVHGCFWLVSGISLLLDSWRTPTAWLMVYIGLLCPLTMLKIALVDPRVQ